MPCGFCSMTEKTWLRAPVATRPSRITARVFLYITMTASIRSREQQLVSPVLSPTMTRGWNAKLSSMVTWNVACRCFDIQTGSVSSCPVIIDLTLFLKRVFAIKWRILDHRLTSMMNTSSCSHGTVARISSMMRNRSSRYLSGIGESSPYCVDSSVISQRSASSYSYD